MTVALLSRPFPRQAHSGHADILIVGAGISGIGMGHYVARGLMGKTFATELAG